MDDFKRMVSDNEALAFNPDHKKTKRREASFTQGGVPLTAANTLLGNLVSRGVVTPK